MLRRFARDQWVRVHGTPRITVLVGGAAARALWDGWLAAGALDGAVLDGPLDEAVAQAAARAVAQPATPIAIHCAPAALAAWRDGRRDRLAAMVAEGVVDVAEPEIAGLNPVASGPAGAPRPGALDARSAAELALFEALEATPATAGRFELNGYLSVRFGASAAEVDLLSRRDRIAVEIDGFYHFTDLDAYRRDRQKDMLLQSQGLFVIRVLAQDVMRDARPAVNAVCQALAVRLRDQP
ncbi:MAG TPA: DUF559 domain-containing protein [Kofleriaceae bacterium]